MPAPKKRRKDQKVENTGGTTRVKPIKTVKGSDGRVQTQQIKYADGSSHVNRYVDGELTDKNYVPKKMRKKKIKKIRKKRTPRPKKVPMPTYTTPDVYVDAEMQEEYDRRKKYNKNKKKKRIVKKIKDTTKRIVDKITPKKRPKIRKVRNLVTGGVNRVR